MDRKRWLIGLAATALVVTMLPAATAAAGLEPVWTRQFGTDMGDYVTGVATDSRGAFVLVGDTEGAFPRRTNRGRHDAFVRVVGKGGRLAWTRQFGTDEMDTAWDVAVDGRDRVVVAGVTEGSLPRKSSAGSMDAFVRVYKRNGSVAWTKQFGTAGDDEATAVAVDRNGRIVVVGYTWGILAGKKNRGRADVFVRVYRPDGRVSWTRQFGSTDDEVAWDVAVDGVGRIVVVGYTRGQLPGKSSAGAEDAFVRVYKPNGRLAWTQQFGTAEAQHARGVAVGRQGRIIVIGTTEGDLTLGYGLEDGFVRMYRRDGTPQWTYQFGTGSTDEAVAVAIDDRQRIFIVGTTRGDLGGPQAGDGDVYVHTMNSFGRVISTRQFGTVARDRGRAVVVDRRSRVAVAGYTEGVLANQAAGDADGFLRVHRQ